MDSKIGKYIANTLKILILGIAVYFIYHSVNNNENFNEEFKASIFRALQWENAIGLVVLFVLIAFNWAFEALKWKHLVKKLEKVSFVEAFKGVLTGLTMSFVTTTNAGAYFGRVWQLKNERRYEILGGVVINSLSQSAVTYFFGGIGLIYFLTWKDLVRPEWFWYHQIGYIIVALSVIFFVFNSGKLVRVFQRLTKVYRYLEIIQQYTLKDNLIVLALSMFRYFTYFSQFTIIMILFGVDLPMEQLLAGISLVYLAKSIIPNFSFLTDLGIREFTAMQLMGSNGFGVSDALVISATLSLWLINILFPVAIGAIFTWQMRILNQKKKTNHETA